MKIERAHLFPEKGLLLLCLSLISMISVGQDNNIPLFHLTKDSIQNYFNVIDEGWLYHIGDQPEYASVAFDDNSWKEQNTQLNLYENPAPDFKGIVWFRLHFIADSTVSDRPLSMVLTHYGASEIYLDGKLLKSFGTINGPDGTENYDPQVLPFVFLIEGIGEHLLAVRYANYEAERYQKSYKEGFSGFKLNINEADKNIATKDSRTLSAAFVLMLLSGIFIALSLIHLFMFLYYRRIKSNLYFSAFMFSMASIFVICFILYSSHSPGLILASRSKLVLFSVFACIAFSAFTSELFEKKKWRLWLLIVLGIVTLVLRYFDYIIFAYLFVALIISVAFEALFTVIFAMIKKVKGAHIIGTGILLFALFILSMFLRSFTVEGNLDLNDSTIGGELMIVFGALAILSIPFSISVYLAWNFSSINKNLSVQLEQVSVLSKKSLEQEKEKQRLLEGQKEQLEKEVWERTSELRSEKKKSDDLLLNILPEEVAEELKSKGSADAKLIDEVTVLFTDFKGFTQLSESLTPSALIAEINTCFSAFDHIVQKYGVEKIKTIGDAYMAAGGIPTANKTHAKDVLNAALEIRSFMDEHKALKLAKGELFFEIRIGIHSGPVVAGIVGVKKFAYDIWGDTVNTASRMESSGEIGKVNISGTTYELVKDQFNCQYRGEIDAKGKGKMAMYFVESKRMD